MKQLLNVLRLHHHNGLVSSGQPFVQEVQGNLDGRLSSALAAACLQHEEALFLNSEFDVLHVMVVGFEDAHVAQQLVVGLRKSILQRGDGLRGPDSRYN